MANSGKIASSLWKMSTLSLLSLCVFFADQIVCFSVGHPHAGSSQLRPEPNSLELEAPAGEAVLPAAVSLQSHSSRGRRELTSCSREFKTLFNSRYSKFLLVFDSTVRGVEPEPRSADGDTTLQLESTGFNSVVRIKSSNGCIGVQDGAVRRFANEDRSTDNDHTLWCEIGTAAGFQFRHFGPDDRSCSAFDAPNYLKVERNGDVNLSTHNGSFFLKL